MGLSVFTYLGLLVFSLLGLLVALGLAVLLGAGPLGEDAHLPEVTAPVPAVGLGDATRVAGDGPNLADHRVAGGSPTLAVKRVRGETAATPVVAVSAGRPLQGSGPAESPSPVPSEPVSATPEPAAEPAPLPSPAPRSASTPHLVANFENGLEGWTTPAGDWIPRLAGVIVRDGGTASLVRLTGDQSSSRLILGGDGGMGDVGGVQIREGDEYAFAFSFYIQTMVYGEPGADNLIMRLKSDAAEEPALGLQLWDWASTDWHNGARGLWSSGSATGGPRFLGPVGERTWHDVIVHFRASAQGAGFYEVYFDGNLVDARSGVSVIVPGSGFAQIEVGLFRDSERVQGTSELRIDAARLGDTLESVLP
ncbi:MAG TPA: heparin lyase I family protein [Solirubrobacterales bacterium]